MVALIRPLLTDAGKPATFQVEALNERGEMVPTAVAGEHPLTLYLDKREIVTLMTLGQAPEALAIGYLRNQRLVGSIEEIAAVQVDWETDSAAVTTRRRSRGGLKGLAARMSRRTVTSGCGQGTMFGDVMEEIGKVRLRDDVTLSDAELFVLIEKVRKYETIYKQAGAVHGCALAAKSPDGAEILMFVEDVGRHNAVDAIAGFMWLDGIDGTPLLRLVQREPRVRVPEPRVPRDSALMQRLFSEVPLLLGARRIRAGVERRRHHRHGGRVWRDDVGLEQGTRHVDHRLHVRGIRGERSEQR